MCTSPGRKNRLVVKVPIHGTLTSLILDTSVILIGTCRASGNRIVHASCHTAKTKCRKFETNIPRKGISGPQSQFPHSCVCQRIIYSHDGSAFSLEEICGPILGIYKSLTCRHMNVETGTEAALFPEKEYINGSAVTVQPGTSK